MKKILFITLLLSTFSVASDIYATFNVKANKEATLAFTNGGTVTAILVDVGSRVKQGELLAHLNYQEQKAQLNLAKADYDNANDSLKRYKKVKDLMDEEKFAQIKLAAIKTKYALQLRQAQYDKCFLKAPFDGVIVAKHKEVGDAVAGVQPQAFFDIMDTSSVKLLLSFDEKYASKVSVGDMFEFTIDGETQKRTATISKVYPSVNSNSRKLFAEVMTKDITPGLFGTGIIKAK